MALLPLGVVVTSWVVSVIVYASSKDSPPEEYATYGPRRPLAGNFLSLKVKKPQEEEGERLCASHWAVTGPHQSLYVKVSSKDQLLHQGESVPLLSSETRSDSNVVAGVRTETPQRIPTYYSTHSDPSVFHGV